MKRLIFLPFLIVVLFIAFIGQSHADLIVPSATYPTIQSAVNAASDGDVVIVENGTYTGAGIGDKAITIRSRNGPDSSIIDCEGVGTGFSSFQTETGMPVIDGFTIQNCIDGISVDEAWAMTISNCIIKDNQNNGISFVGYPTRANARVTNCTITENGGGIELLWYRTVHLDNCVIDRNGYGILGQIADVRVTDSIINENQSSGIYLYEGSCYIANSIINGNSGRGISSYEGYGLDIENCIISGNIFGISFNSAWQKGTITNSTVSRNTMGGINTGDGSESDAMITNSILWGNSTPTEPELIGLALITNSNIDQDGFAGVNGNIRQDPLFINPEQHDFHLQLGSPCIDAGDNNAPELPNTDIDGNPRIMDGIVDMGAYEYPGNQEPPVAYDMNVSTEEETPVNIILESYDKDLIYEFGKDKTGNQNNFTANGNGDNIPEPSTNRAGGDYSAYFESANDEHLIFDDIDALFNMSWKSGTINKTGTIWLKFKAPQITNHGVLFGKYNRGADKRTLFIQLSPITKAIHVYLGYNNGDSSVEHTHGTALEPNVWYAVGVSFEQNGGNAADPEMIYIEIRTVSDGAIVGSNYSAIAFDNPDNHEININDAPYMIGAILNSATSIFHPFEGYIDEVMIFNEKMNGNTFAQYASDTYFGGPDCLLDFEHTPLTYSIVFNPFDGGLSGTPPNVTYTPDSNFYGNDSFTFKVNDGYVDSNIATVNITVDPVNDAPTITGQLPLETESGVALTITLNDLKVNDIDNDYPEDFTLHVQAGSNYTLSGNTITSSPNFTGTLVVPVYVNDGTDYSNKYNLTVNIIDECPNDPNKTKPGICGCDTPDTDTDNDFVPDCIDNCPNDPNKINPGICGCGIPDFDSDLDGKPDCNDNCDSNLDTDGDGVGDCDESCPNDPDKTDPGVCGCGLADTDTDNDGIIDCIDFQLIAKISSPTSNQTINIGKAINFQCSILGGNPPYTYSWKFDGAADNSTQQDPGNVVFSEVGTYTVTLAVADADGDIDSDTVVITVTEASDDGDDGGGGGGGGGFCFVGSVR